MEPETEGIQNRTLNGTVKGTLNGDLNGTLEGLALNHERPGLARIIHLAFNRE